MAVQTSYSENMRAGVVGMLAEMGEMVLISRNVEDAAGFAFGIPVVQGTADTDATAIGSGDTDVVGITVRERSVNPVTGDGFNQYDSARLLRKGVMFVEVTDAGGVAAGDEVWVTLATGAFSNADVGTDGGLQLAGSRWETSAANGDIAKVRFNLDVPAVAGAS